MLGTGRTPSNVNVLLLVAMFKLKKNGRKSLWEQLADRKPSVGLKRTDENERKNVRAPLCKDEGEGKNRHLIE